MQHRMIRVGVAVVFFLAFAAGTPLAAQEYEVLASFQAAPAAPSGGLAVGPDGLYGTAGGGAYDYGVVYRFVPPSTENPAALTMLHSFVDTDAAADLARPAFPPTPASDGNFYGIRGGGPYGGFHAAVYRLTASGEQSLVRQLKSPDDGYSPRGPLVEVGGLLYGACGAGGLPGQTAGTLFALSTTGDFEVVHRFSGGSDGANPPGGLALRPQDGRLYGVTAEGGEFGEGTIFRFDPISEIFETLHSFDPVADGYWPRGELTVAPDGSIYGVLPYKNDGLGSCGTIFRLDPDAPEDGLDVVHVFSCAAGEPKGPLGGVTIVDGFLYGVTEGESVPSQRAPGVVYRIELESGALDVLHAFDPEAYFQGELTAAPDGLIYGQSRGALSSADAGTIFRIDPATGEFATVHRFGPSPAPRRPHSVIEGSGGGLVAASNLGGESNLGTVFRVVEGGQAEVIHSFADGGSSSYRVRADLILGSDGLVYGTRTLGGTNGAGSVFTIDPAGAYHLVHSFDSTVRRAPAYPDGALIESRFEPGTFFGTLSSGWGVAGGVYELSPGGVTLLATFNLETGTSRGRLVQTADGTLFGVISEFSYITGGYFEHGGLFAASPAGGGGRFRTLSWYEGEFPQAGMVERRTLAGDETFLYGTAPSGGATYDGTIFKLSSAREFSVVHSFSGADGAEPWAEMALAADGNLYGTTRTGGLHGYGTIFAVTPADEVVTVHHFDHTDGAWPEGALFVGSDGNVYGTTASGGPGGGGTVFRFNLAPEVDLSGPVSIDEGDAATLTAAAVDPQGGPVAFAWDLDGDGGFDEGAGPTIDFVADIPERDGPGDYPVAVRATDESGVATVASTVVTVANVAPEVSVIPAEAEAAPGAAVALEISFIDPGPDTWTAAVDWGDGTIESLGSVASPFTASHVFTESGTFAVLVTVTDDDGGEGTATATVTVGTVNSLIEELIVDVGELIDDGEINYGRGRSLIAELQVALWFLQWNNGETQAIVRIQLFIQKVQIMIRTDQLDPELGNELIAKAEAILELLRVNQSP